MRFSVNVPNFGDFADPRAVATLAATAEQAGWDGLFVWDHVLHRRHQKRPFADPWMLLTAAALTTSRIRLGTLLTPVPRYRPQQLARQVATLDRLSGGRVVFAAGLGGPVEDEYASFGDTAGPRELAGRLDEGLELLARLWSGEPVDHQGRHYTARDMTLLPATAQRPRPPVWIGGFWPHRGPMRRAARWDGAVPLFETARHGQVPDVTQVRELIGFVREQRAGGKEREERPFEFVLGGATDPATARDVIGPLRDAGATWWDERRLQGGPDLDRLAPVLRRVEAGPPTL
ncbi:LLM class flavin-dependent oxidoreductase [Streptomyces misionensis]|uniref:LLM class flavin-dependent oxidoreductase n=1 Tax=Streptomyces misionensis TaxID=67331 RepID=A0A5C6JYL7_9ACTN|nr:LLM class flavin-dependent oxidoreductase [Streptomyces misionensis]TWV53926.1 LLM class flavin-dependent oxidoreductase [Streptomyces misionensis]